jgi:dTDP-4-dehydrorhamnose 3,5-epimerase
MKFRRTDIEGVVEIEMEPVADERGDFARTYCAETFLAAGIELTVCQTNLSRNHQRGTLRGMHYQDQPNPDPKLVRCNRGRIFDVAVDLRRDSPSFCRWTATELDSNRHNALFVPAGCAHGFLTLEDDCDVAYMMGTSYVAELARGVRWNDPAFGIEWPFEPSIMSDRDAAYPDFVPASR